MSKTKEELKTAFKEAGCRLTRQRERIFEYLAKASQEGAHPSARHVYEGLRGGEGGMSVATVYNTLGTLVRLGLIKIMEFESGDNRYETCLDPHVNLVCTSCGGIQDLAFGSPIDTAGARDRLGFEVRDFRFEYYGLCAGCRGDSDPR